ncbi:MAG: AAA family ATPase [Pirellulaceae bacterium]|nr:AAA family ATPase [Pirellulaceae bacterium]
MILRKLSVEGWRCFANPIELGPLDDRINVIHGPNGAGKSTLMGAMIRGLMDNHALGGKAADALRSWGRNLTPKIVLELEHDGHRLRLAKQFLDKASSELSRWEGDQWMRLAEGRAADQRARAMLDGSLPSRGLTSEEHWGLAQVLWASQGKLKLADLADGVAGAIRESLGAQIADPRTDAIEKLVGQQYDKVFTETGRLKGGHKNPPRIVQLEEELRHAKLRRDELVAKCDQFEELSRQIQDFARRRDELADAERQLAAEVAQLETSAESYDRLKHEQARQSKELEAADARYGQLKSHLAAIDAAREEQRKLADDIAGLDAKRPGLDERLTRCLAEESETTKLLEELASRRERIKMACDAADRASRYVEAKKRLAEQDRVVAEAAELHASIERLVLKREAIVAPDTARLRAIKTAVARRDGARVELRAAMIGVTIEPESAFEIDVEQAAEPGTRRAAPGEPVTLAGSPAVVFRIPGVGRFRATGPTGSVEEVRRQLDAAEAELAALVAGFGSDAPAALESLHDEAAALDQQVSTIRARLHGLLGQDSPDVLRARRGETAALVGQIEDAFPDWTATPPDAEALGAAARELQLQFDVDNELIDRRHREAHRARLAAESERNQAESRAADRRASLEKVVKQLDSLIQLNNTGPTEADQRTELEQRAMAVHAARGQLRETSARLDAFADDPNEKLRKTDEQLAQVRVAARQRQLDQNQLIGQLTVLQNDGPASALNEADERIARLREEIAAERLANDATRLLFVTLRECRNEAVGAVIGPVQRRATDLLERIAGGRLGSVECDESFLPKKISPDRLPEPVEINETSGGEQEQIHLAVRLALAEVLLGGQRQTVVLDDILTATDDNRLRRVLAILDETAERCQLLIFTCHPERYRGLTDATFFDLETIHGRPPSA